MTTINQYNQKETDPRYSRMIWGKYRGYFIKDVPLDYLRWAVLNYTDQAMARFLADELVRRDPTLKKPLKK
jgi:hypothetical protein